MRHRLAIGPPQAQGACQPQLLTLNTIGRPVDLNVRLMWP